MNIRIIICWKPYIYILYICVYVYTIYIYIDLHRNIVTNILNMHIAHAYTHTYGPIKVGMIVKYTYTCQIYIHTYKYKLTYASLNKINTK